MLTLIITRLLPTHMVHSHCYLAYLLAGRIYAKVQRFLRILAKSRNGTEGTEILGIPVPVTGMSKVARFLPDHAATRRHGARGAAPRLLTARRFSCARTARRLCMSRAAGA